MGLDDQAAVDVESVVAAKKSQVGFVVSHLFGESVALDQRDVGRVGHDHIDRVWREAFQKIGLQERHGGIQFARVLASHGEGVGR